MNSHLRPLFAAAVLVLALSTTGANASLIVTGTPDTGALGSTANPTFTIDTSSSPGIDVAHIGGWDFRLTWTAGALDFDPTASSIAVKGISYTLPGFLAYLESLDTDFDPAPDVFENLNQAAGSYQFTWVDLSLDPLKQLDIGSSATSIVFTGAFLIEAGAVPGTPNDVSFGASMLADSDPTPKVATYASASPAMQVTRQPDPIPEPGILGLLLGGLGVMGAARLRRRNSL